MFERYTERARRVLFFARYEASQLGSVSIESEHLLLGLVREGKGLTSRVFAKAGVSLPDVRRDVEGKAVARENPSTSHEIPFTAETKRILQHTAVEADRLLHNYIGTEHLLLGILREERSVAATILHHRGLTLEGVREQIVSLLGEKDPRERPRQEWQDTGGPAPAYVPSRTVHVTFSRELPGSGTFSEGPRHWVLTGADLRSVIVHAWRDVRWVDMQGVGNDGLRYDVVLTLRKEESADTRVGLVRTAIEQLFELDVTSERRADGEALVVRPKSS